jgi:drug/metabolite transporter (DMT)-like permease
MVPSNADAMLGTRAATARSVRSATRRVYADRFGGAVAREAAFGTLGTVDRTRLTGVALVVVSAFAFGSGGLFARPVYATGVDWLTLMAWRFGIAGALAWVVVLARPGSRASLRAMPRGAVLGAVGLGVLYVSNTATYYAAIAVVPLSLAALIVYIYPPVVAVLALRLGRPLEGRRAWTALGIAVAGVVLAVGGISAAAMPPISGLLLVIMSPLFYSVWIILAARHAGERSDRTGHGSDSGADPAATGAVMLSSTGIAYWASNLALGHPVLPPAIPSEAWPGIIGVGLVAGFLAIQAFYAGAARVGAAQASLISTVEPLWTIVWSYLLFGERLEPVQWIGGAMILAGVILAQTRGRSAVATSPDEAPPLPQPAVHLSEE